MVPRGPEGEERLTFAEVFVLGCLAHISFPFFPLFLLGVLCLSCSRRRRPPLPDQSSVSVPLAS